MGWMGSGGREEARRIAPVLQLAFLVTLPHFVHPDFALTLGLVICIEGSCKRWGGCYGGWGGLLEVIVDISSRGDSTTFSGGKNRWKGWNGVVGWMSSRPGCGRW